jgi:hypothetical protein
MRVRLALPMVLVAVLVATASGAGATEPAVVRKGHCDGPSTWKLVTRRVDAATLNIRVELTGGAAGQTWSMVVTDDGSSVIRATKLSGPGGFVRWTRRTADRPGSDLVEMAGYNRQTGEICRGALVFSG